MIQYIKRPSPEKVHWAFNNSIMIYHDPQVPNPTHSYVNIGQTRAKIYPNPDGRFFFNFKGYIQKMIVDEFKDTFSPNITANPMSLVYNGGGILELDITVTVLVGESIGDQSLFSLTFIAGVEQLEQYQKQETHEGNFFVLTTPKRYTRRKYRVHYWAGYPFDFSLYWKQKGSITLQNEKSGLGLSLNIPGENKITRIALSDGKSDITIDDFLPLIYGTNRISISPTMELEGTPPLELDIVKHTEECGIYVKYRNLSGGWSYWLFSENHRREIDVKQGEELDNDLYNINETEAPTLQTGVVSSQEKIKAYSGKLTEDDARHLSQIIESPKIYIYTAPPYSEGKSLTYAYEDTKKWMVVKCLTSKLVLVEPQRKIYTFLVEFALPERNKINLL